jgi:pyrrolidone-carboxylate peptidase
MRFPAGDSGPGGTAHRVLVSGFDPFQLDGSGVRISNPAGTSALQLDGKVFDTPNGKAVVRAVSFPVVWGYFDQGIVEAAYGSALRDSDRRPDLIMTLSRSYPVNYDQVFCVWPDSTHPGTGSSVCRSDAPKAGEIAAQGSGGDYLSNESMYRANRIRLGLGTTGVRGGHLHTPVLGQPTDPVSITDSAFEARRKAIADQTAALVDAAAMALP